MQRYHFWLFAGAALAGAAPAHAAGALKFGAAPSWVVPQAIPDLKPSERPIELLLYDQQLHFEPGKTVVFGDLAMRLQTAEGLSAGSLSLPWDPATDTVTVNKLLIHRGKQVIDVLAAGQTFTTMRRESNLELAALDGVLTANIQPEGLQQGDIVELATTVEHVDPVTAPHIESSFGVWPGLPVRLAHVRAEWPASMKLNTQIRGELPAALPVTHGGSSVLEFTMHDVEPVIVPKSAPPRFTIGRLGEITDFRDWSDVARLAIPLFRRAETIPSSGPLHDEVEKIRAGTTDPKQRAAQALQLVQDRVRYLALLMGQGGYVPAAAADTWSRRYGDCKAKTALLLGILHALDIHAEPILVQSKFGDALPDRLPMLSYFDHVLVRSHIGDKTYYLDGTRTGDADLDQIEVPNFGWGLPVLADAKLERMLPAPRTVPDSEHQVSIDATAGIFAPAAITIEELSRGDSAVVSNSVLSTLTADQRNAALRDIADKYFDEFEMTGSSVVFNKATRTLDLSINGRAKLEWKDDWFFVPTSTIAYNADFDRPAGPTQDAPFAIGFPSYVKDTATLRLPPGFASQQKLDAPVKQTLAGVEYSRSESVAGDVLTVQSSERSLTAEVPYKDALAAAARLRGLYNDDVYISSNVSYSPSDNDLSALATSTPASVDEYVTRGNLYLDRNKFDEAIVDFTNALKLEPKDQWALANRGLAYVWKHQFGLAEKDLSASLAGDSTNSVALRGSGLMSEFNNDWQKAVDFYGRSLAQDPKNSFALAHRAYCEHALGNEEQALADSSVALSLSTSWMELRVIRANILYLKNDVAGVAREAELIVRENPKSGYAYVAAAKMLAKIGRRDDAMLAFSQALAIKPESYIYINRAQVRMASDLSGRKADIDAALRLEPDDPDTLFAKAQMLSDEHDYAGALSALAKTKPDDEDLQVSLERAVLLYKAGRKADATAAFDALHAKAGTAREFNASCWVKAINDIMVESAAEDCRNALKLRPGTGQYLDSLGMALLKLGKLDEALDAYNKAVAQKTGASSLMGRAIVYSRKGDQVRADADAASARKLDHDIDQQFAEYGLKFDAKAAAAAPTAR